MNVALAAVFLAFCGPGEPGPDGPISVDKDKKTIRVACKIAPRKLPNLPAIYPIEVIACWPTPKGQKAHETIVIFDVLPSDVHKAIESLGLKAGKPGRGDDRCSGPEVEVFLDLPAVNGHPAGLVSIDKLLVDMRTGKTLPAITWHFTGSVVKDGKFAADSTGTLIGLYPVTDELIVQSNFTMREESLIKVETNKQLLPGEGTPVTLVIKVGAPAAAAKAAGFDAEKQVLKLSTSVGPGPAAAPPLGGASVPPTAATPDPFENRKEVLPGKSLQDATRPVDAPPAQK